MKKLTSLFAGLLLGAAGLVGVTAATPQYTFARGVNISHWLSQNAGTRTYAAPWFDEEDVSWIAAQGFDHIRLPVDFRSCLTPDGKVDAAKLEPIQRAIGWAKSRHLGLVLDAHFLPGADFNDDARDTRAFTDEKLQAHVADIWREIARRFAGEGDYLRMEVLNEPVADQNAQVNPLMQRVLAAIRESNPTRVVYVTSNRWSQFATVPDVVLPDDPHIAFTVHYYDPHVFTHQRAPWAGLDDTMPAVKFPGVVPDLTGHTLRPDAKFPAAGTPLTVAQVRADFAKVAAWVEAHRPGTEVYLGEFGVYRAADPESQRNWLATVVAECKRHGWSWAIWDYQGGFAVRNPEGQGTPILDGLFRAPPPAP